MEVKLWLLLGFVLVLLVLSVLAGRSILRHIATTTEVGVANLRLQAELSNIAHGLCMFDARDRLRLVNLRYCEMLRLDPASVQPGLSFRDLMTLCTTAGALTAELADATFEHRSRQIEQGLPTNHAIALEDGRTIAILHRPMPDGGWVSTCEDVTDRLQAEAQIRHMARHDALTGLPNRAVLQETIEHAVSGLDRGGAFAILFIDLDHFKAVNETMGFPAGDCVLRQVASRLVECVRKTETVARLGADQFAVLMPGLDRPEDAGDIARRLLDALGEPLDVNGSTVVLGASIGVVMAPADGAASDALLRKAQLALDRAKLDGPGSVCFFEPQMDARQQTRRALETDLRAGLVNREFELLYQPLVDLAENRVCGFEALLRWNRSAGRVSPADFIPIAEANGLIVPIGEWVLARACEEAAGWPDDVKVAVNVSPVQFRSASLVLAVQDALARSGLPPSRLEIEITESVLMTDNDLTLATLHQLRALGVSISMDDFGTGFSSLSYLRSFPFDKIKIDQSFIRNLIASDGSGGNALAIVRAIAGLGNSLGMRTTAEGVETHEQLDRLRREGCTEVQGYLLSRPAPASEVQTLIARFAEPSYAAMEA